MSTASQKPVVYIISDSIGETAEFVVKAAASQYDSEDMEVRRVPFVSDAARVIEIVEEAAGANSMIAYTLVLPELRQLVEREAAKRDIPTADIMGPAMSAFAKIMKKEPYLEPRRVRRLDE
ncbi:MAG TPA: kinase/pyrophosphorylase, partial [Bacillota bacterium]|nr:kinase/pyrophosphorylase [Bacillota bacterium]